MLIQDEMCFQLIETPQPAGKTTIFYIEKEHIIVGTSNAYTIYSCWLLDIHHIM